MAKLTPAQMKKAVEEFKKKFTGGFYHGSPSPNIKAFDSLKSPKGPEEVTPGVTFAARDPKFANSFLPDTFDEATNTMVHPFDPGSTVYPISIDMSNHFDPKTKEGQAVLADFVRQKFLSGENQDKKAAAKFLTNISDPHSNWATMEGTDFLDYLKNTGHKSFEVRESGFKNVGVFDPKNIRGKFAKFNPEDAESADFMKAAGGRIVKKALEHARQVPFVHYSNAPNISTLDPNRYGTGIKGAEAGRLKNEPDIRPRSYFYVDQGEKTMPKEAGLGPHKYTGTAEGIYPLEDDPMGFSAIAKQKALDPYLASKGIMQADEREHLNELERLIKGAGYSGYSNNAVGLLFNPTQVIKSD
jgi:hypothetical protein